MTRAHRTNHGYIFSLPSLFGLMGLTALFALSASGCVNGESGSSPSEAEAHTPLADSALRIINGLPAHGREFDPVVHLAWRGYGLCSGTVISDHYVLTAAHCVHVKNCKYDPVTYEGHDCQLETDPTTFQVLIHEKRRETPSQVRGVSEIHAHPAYDAENFVHDIALLKLERPFEGLTPIPALPDEDGLRWTQQDEGITVTFAGFGLDENGASGDRLMIENEADVVCLGERRCSGIASPNTICHHMGDGLICSGDSGGPLILERGGVRYVGGVTAYGDENCTGFGCSTAVSPYAQWISEVMGGEGRGSGDDCIQSDQCRSGICSMGVCCDTVCTDAPCIACSAFRGRPEAAHGTCGEAISPCDDGDACTLNDTCEAGKCQSGTPKECPASDQCNAASVCDSATGLCQERSPLPLGTLCDDKNACTLDDRCVLGSCIGSGSVTCLPLPCKKFYGAGCMPETGECRYIDLEDGTSCTDASGKSATCSAGVCGKKDSGSGCSAAGGDTLSLSSEFLILGALFTALRRRRRAGGQASV